MTAGKFNFFVYQAMPRGIVVHRDAIHQRQLVRHPSRYTPYGSEHQQSAAKHEDKQPDHR
jgi:hypothetical protein